MFGLPFGFAAPAVLIGLAALPIIWWLLRLTPPKPDTEVFPPLRILQSLIKRDETPSKSPWWLTLLRLCLAALIILALARPLLNPREELQLADGPLLILIDNSWAAATDWEAKTRTANALIEQASSNEKSVAIALTVSPENADVSLVDAAAAQAFLATATPIAASPDRDAALEKLADLARANQSATVAFLTDGLAQDTDADAFAQVTDVGVEKAIFYEAETDNLTTVVAANNRSDAMEVVLQRVEGQSGVAVYSVSATDEKGRLLARADAEFASGENEAIASFEAPFELRNDMAVLRIGEQSHAGATYLLDENNKRRRFALFSGLAGDQAQPLLEPLYYIERAISPYADIIRPRSNDLATAIPEIIDQGPAVIVMADIGVVPNSVEQKIDEWLEAGGTLVRFAGPRLATSASDDPYLPVALRESERALGGALTWTEPQIVAPFSAQGPFAELQPPREVTVNRQILAEPTPELASRTWASLADGTPLVTGARRGKGTIVLFHVTAEATWSNLPISGAFVDMLRRIADLSLNTGKQTTANNAAAAGTLSPLRIIRADGELIPPPAFVKPLDVSANTIAAYETPAGLYGVPSAFTALNLLNEDSILAPFATPDIAIETETRALVAGEQRDLSGYLFLGALVLLLLDTLAMLWIGGRFKGLTSKRKVGAATAFVLAAMIAMTPDIGFAQDVKDSDDLLIESLETTRIAYVLTGQSETDKISAAGISGISRFLALRTAFEPGEPVGLDLERDELSPYPLIYFPIDANADMLSPKAIARLDSYMQNGGTILFDTRDEIGGALNVGPTPENQRLREIVKDLNVPALEPVAENHVLTKAFYILETFPGLYESSPLWVEALGTEVDQDRPVRSADGVSPVIITGNDFASAWALDETGRPLRPMSNPLQRMFAFRSGVNIMMYMLTGNYKADQVHIPALLERLGQ